MVQAINLSTQQCRFIAKAFILGYSRQSIGCIVFPVIFSHRCGSVLVKEPQSVSTEGKVPGLRANGTTGSSLHWRQTELQVERNNPSFNICGSIIEFWWPPAALIHAAANGSDETEKHTWPWWSCSNTFILFYAFLETYSIIVAKSHHYHWAI